jgi:hypothetical protein
MSGLILVVHDLCSSIYQAHPYTPKWKIVAGGRKYSTSVGHVHTPLPFHITIATPGPQSLSRYRLSSMLIRNAQLTVHLTPPTNCNRRNMNQLRTLLFSSSIPQQRTSSPVCSNFARLKLARSRACELRVLASFGIRGCFVEPTQDCLNIGIVVLVLSRLDEARRASLSRNHRGGRTIHGAGEV